jgi:hypothetical protein
MMATTEERMRILKMIDEGKITAEDGAKLLSALSVNRSRTIPTVGIGRAVGNARWLRVKVTDIKTGRSKATVQIPIGLLDAGMKIGAHFAPEVDGVDMDMLAEALRSGATGKIFDVIDEQDGEHVEIYVE